MGFRVLFEFVQLALQLDDRLLEIKLMFHGASTLISPAPSVNVSESRRAISMDSLPGEARPALKNGQAGAARLEKVVHVQAGRIRLFNRCILVSFKNLQPAELRGHQDAPAARSGPERLLCFATPNAHVRA
jgi:hypothetical protein